jgi:hypothetical protein
LNGQCACSPCGTAVPHAVGDVDWATPTLLRWEVQPCAAGYNVYRLDTMTILPDRNGDGVADGYGSCLLSGIGTNEVDVGAVPPDPQHLWIFLVTAENAKGEGTFQPASNGMPRPNLSPCP